MSTPDPSCPTCLGRGTYRAGGLDVECLCTRRGCPRCPPGDTCDGCFMPVATHTPEATAACDAERKALARFEAQQRDLADSIELDRVGGPVKSTHFDPLPEGVHALLTSTDGLRAGHAFDTLVLRRSGVYALGFHQREPARLAIEEVARRIGDDLGWTDPMAPDGVWAWHVRTSTQRARETALRIGRACGVGRVGQRETGR